MSESETTVYVVDDDSSMREALSSLIRSIGMRGLAAASAVASLLRRHQVSMPVASRVETAHSAIGLVLAGEGLAILPACAQLGSPRGVVFRPFRDAEDSIEIAVCWRRDSISPLIRTFLKCAEKVAARI